MVGAGNGLLWAGAWRAVSPQPLPAPATPKVLTLSLGDLKAAPSLRPVRILTLPWLCNKGASRCIREGETETLRGVRARIWWQNYPDAHPSLQPGLAVPACSAAGAMPGLERV